MAKDEQITKHTLNLYAGDYARIQMLFPDVGAGPVIRRIVRDFLVKIDTETPTERPNVEVKI